MGWKHIYNVYFNKKSTLADVLKISTTEKNLFKVNKKVIGATFYGRRPAIFIIEFEMVFARRKGVQKLPEKLMFLVVGGFGVQCCK